MSITRGVGLSTITFLLVAFAWSPLLVLLHELGHAVAALALTDGEVAVILGRGSGLELAAERFRLQVGLRPSPTALCMYQPTTLRRRRAEAWIALAGPAVSLATGVLLFRLASDLDGHARDVLFVGGLGAVGPFLASARPVRYGAGLSVGDSDGRVVWLVLTGGRLRAAERPQPAERIAHPVFLVLLGLVALVTVFLDVWLLIALVGMFAFAWHSQRTHSARGD
jgi:hypothetical protein